MAITTAKAARAVKWAQLKFLEVEDPRRARGLRHLHEGLLRLAVVALATGKQTLRGVEAMGEDLGARGRRQLGLKTAPSDTCHYDLLAKQSATGFDLELAAQVKGALAAKTIGNDLFGEGVAAFDGKSAWSGDHEALEQARKTTGPGGEPGWYVMSQRVCLVSSSARPVLHQRFIDADAGEADTFPASFAFLCEHFDRSFEIVTYDAGGCSRSNATLVNGAQKAYWFAVKGNQPTVHGAARSRLGSHEAPDDAQLEGEASTYDRARGADVVREAFGVFVEKDDPEVDFANARQLWRIRQTSTWSDDAGCVTRRVVEDRYFITNRVFTADRALRLARLHWGIENGPNWTMDMVLGEDDGTVCTKGEAVEVVSWLRLLAYNLVAIWRRKLPRNHGETPSWDRACELLRDALLAASPSLAPLV